MKRAGGWTIGLVAVIGMAAAGFLGLRPILFRKPLPVEFFNAEGWQPQEETGVRLAFAEKGFRAGGMPVQPEFRDSRRAFRPESAIMTVWRSGDLWWVDAQPASPTGPRHLELLPQLSQLGAPAARWTKRKAFTRVFIPGFVNSNGFVAEFNREAAAGGVECSTERSDPQGRSLLDAFRTSKADLVILKREEAAPLARVFEQAGFAGRFLIVDDMEVFPTPRREETLLEGAFVVSRFVPDPASVTGKVPSAGPAPAPGDSLGYLMATLVLDAIDRTSSGDPWEVFHRLAQSPEFNAADGRSTLPGGLYVIKNGRFEFLEPLK